MLNSYFTKGLSMAVSSRFSLKENTMIFDKRKARGCHQLVDLTFIVEILILVHTIYKEEKI